LNRRKKLINKVFENVEITGFAAEGKAIARIGEQVLFVRYGAPGDLVDVQVKKVKRNFLEGNIVRIHRPSAQRTKPFCKHFGVCGGCKWQHLNYEEQLRCKYQQVIDSLQRIGKIDMSAVEVLPIAASEKTTFYRNKLEFTFSNRRWLTQEDIDSGEQINDPEGLGFHIPGFFDKVLDIEKCWLQADPSNEIRLKVKQFAVENQLSFYDLRKHTGLLRNLIIRTTPSGETMVIVVFGADDPGPRSLLMDFIQTTFPQVSSLFFMVNTKKNSSIGDLEPVLFSGNPFIVEEMEGLKFQIGPKSFYQTNSWQAYRLYSIARDFAGLSGKENVYDLYTGTGTIALFVAAKAGKVTGIEFIEEAVAHALHNATLNGIDNAQFYAGDMARVLTADFFKENGFPDVIITDPPRAGMHPDVIRQLNESGAERIVYVSCNPATQARDVEMLSQSYQVTKVQAVDMFPHTQHVEGVILLEKKT